MAPRTSAAAAVAVAAALLGAARSAPAQFIQLQNATAEGSQPNFPVGDTINGVLNAGDDGWADDLTQANFTPPNVAAYETAVDAGFAGGTVLDFNLLHHGCCGMHNLGRFRISATTDDRNDFADGLENGGDVTANWVTLTPAVAVSTSGSSMTINPDNSILVGGAPVPAFDGYRVRVRTNITGITGFRLEALDDPSLPDNGPGRAGNGNFVLSEFQANAYAPTGALPVLLQNSTATGSQAGFSVRDAADLLAAGTGWAADLGTGGGQPLVAAFESAEDINPGGVQTRLTFRLGHEGTCCPDHNLGKFRISATTDDRSLYADGLENGGDVDANWTVLTPGTASSSQGATLTIQPDGSVLASDANAGNEVYTITVETALQNITGFRLETLEDPSLPSDGPGRAGNGNYVLADFSVVAEIVPEPSALAALALGGLGLLRRRGRR